jgi:hypothetical protein
MNRDQQRLSPAEHENLVAYLDGELNEAESRAIAAKLTYSLTARRELDALERTWQLLDLLPRPQASADLTAKTLAQIEQQALQQDLWFHSANQTLRWAWQALALTVSLLLTLGAGYAGTRWLWPDPMARLARELTLAESLDEYRDVGSFAFLQQLDESPEFNEPSALLPAGRMASTEDNPEERLRRMAPEVREALAERLRRFDLLPEATQAQLRALDQQIAQADPTDQARYRLLLRRFHLWLQTLPTSQRQTLESAEGADRLERVAQLRRAQRDETASRPADLLGRVVLLRAGSLVEAAAQMRVWLQLSPQEKAEFDRTGVRKAGLAKMTNRLHELGKQHSVEESDKSIRSQIQLFRKELQADPEARTKLDQLKAVSKAVAQRWAEHLYFLEHPPAPVDPRRLSRFEAEMPFWLREPLEAFPPDLARQRLTILYRLIFPPGTEMELKEPPAAKPEAPTQKAAPRPPARGPAPPAF